jgi:hypothetical protein
VSRHGIEAAVERLHEAVHPAALEALGEPVPRFEDLRASDAHVHGSDHHESRQSLRVLHRIGDGGMGTHRVPPQDERAVSDLLPDHGLDVGDQIRIDVAGRRVGAAVPPSVVGDLAIPAPRQHLRAVDDVAAGGGDSVKEHDRGPVADRLAGKHSSGPLHGELHRLDRGHDGQAGACDRTRSSESRSESTSR